MNKYLVKFNVNNIRTEEVVMAFDTSAARELIKRKYPNTNIFFQEVRLVK